MRYVVLLLLAGCYSPQKHAEGLQRIHGPYCESMGFKRGTDPWRSCIQQREDRNNAAVESIRTPQSCYRVGNQMFCN